MTSKIEFQPLQIEEDDFDEFIDEFDTQLENDNDDDDDDEWDESNIDFDMALEEIRHRRRHRHRRDSHCRNIWYGIIFIVVVVVVGIILAVYIVPRRTRIQHDDQDSTSSNHPSNIHTDSNANDNSIAQPTTTSPKYSVQLSDGKMYELIDIQNKNQQDLKIHHDKSRFTQGLTYSKHSNILFESFGLYGQSGLCQLDPITGMSTKCVNVDRKYFAEGMQVYMDKHGNEEKLIQITWKEQMGFIYNAKTLEHLESFEFTTKRNEGWGICLDEENHEFVVSDGSEYLHFWDVDSLAEKRRVKVQRMNGEPAYKMNELEFVHGKVLANVWYEDVILVIDPVTGKCESEYDLSTLWPRAERNKEHADVLNGISVSKDDGILYITGKNWDRMYTMKLKGFS